MKKSFLMSLCILLCASLAIGGTMAYLQDTDSDVNVMTMGSVKIEQYETDEHGDPFQNQPMYPAVYDGEAPAADNPGIVHKRVTVENTGKSEAYVRTIFAFEHDKDGKIHIIKNEDGAWDWIDMDVMEIDGVPYDVWVANHTDVLPAGETTAESLQQLYMDKTADNEHVEAFGAAYEVLVLSQAVQTAGFENAEHAFTEAFGEVDSDNLSKWLNTAGVVPLKTVTNEEELRDALAAGGNVNIVLANDIEIDADNTLKIPAGASVTLELNNYTLHGVSDKTGSNRNMIDVRGELTVQNGFVSTEHTGANMGWNNSTNVFNVTAGGVLNIDNCEVKNMGGSDMAFAVHMNNWGEVTLNATSSLFYSTYSGIRMFNSGNDMNNLSLLNCEVTGFDRAIWVHNYTPADFGGDESKAAAAAARLNMNIENTVINGVIRYGFTDAKVENGDTVTAGTQEKFAAAIANGAEVIYLSDGTFIIPDEAQGKTLTITGTGNTVIATQDDGSYEGCDYSLDGATVTFEGITINTDSTTYTGYARANATYNNCTINGTYTLYGDSVFNNCEFNVSGDVYNIWTWGAPKAEFNKCVFNSDGKALLLYGRSNTHLTVKDCTFNEMGGLTDLKAAIEIGNDYNSSYYLTVENTVVNGYKINNKNEN